MNLTLKQRLLDAGLTEAQAETAFNAALVDIRLLRGALEPAVVQLGKAPRTDLGHEAWAQGRAVLDNYDLSPGAIP